MKDVKYDFIMRNVTFDSFLKLHNAYNEAYHRGVEPTIYYDGSDICGDVAVVCARYAESDERNKAMKMASETLKYFS